jgi:hypothetical protein
MINNYFQNITLPSGEVRTGVYLEDEHLVLYRTLPYSFRLTSMIGNVQAPSFIRIFTNIDVSRQGAKDAVTALRDYAIAHTEIWTQAQMQAVAGTQTLYIVFNSEKNMRLDFSKDLLTIEQIREANEGAEVWVSYDVSGVGLTTLVNELLAWL